MTESSKARKRDAASEARWGTAAAGSERPPAVSSGDPDAIHELLGAPAVAGPARPSRDRRPIRWVLAAVLLVGVALPVYLWFQYRSGHATSINAAVRGHVSEIGTRISGRVAAVTVDVGDHVQAGQVLVQLEDRHLLAELQEARARVAALQRAIEVERFTIGLEQRQIARHEPEAAARIAAAAARADAVRSEAETARRNQAMQEELHARGGIVSSDELHRAQSERRTADARLEEAEANATVAARSSEQDARLAENGVAIRRHKVAVLEADLLAAEARVSRAEAELESAAIRAPQRGAIVRRIVQPGGAIDAGQPVIAMWLGEDLWVEAWIDEEDLGFVRRGGKATVTFNAFPGREFTGVVDRVGLATDLELPDSALPQPRSSRMRAAPVIGVRIRLDEPPPHLVPGLSAVVAIKKEE